MAWTHLLISLLVGIQPGLAHPGAEETIHLHAAQPLNSRTPHISKCHGALQEPSFVKRKIDRRQNEFDRLRRERGLRPRQLNKLNEYLNKDHQVNKPFNKDTKTADLFADDGACMAAPMLPEGPLYVQGEEIRRNITDNERGVPMTLDIQVVDAKTCAPVPEAAVDIWGCNTTGVYSGVWNFYSRPGLDVGYDRSVINTTALRGIQFTDADGVAMFDTNFPGHYQGRATHIHVMIHLGATRFPNGTIGTSGRVAHIAQLYFDQALITGVEKAHPYTLNQQNLTANANDGLLKITNLTDDPFVRYVMLGDRMEDGLFSYIRLGIDTSAGYKVVPAAWKDENGGHQNPAGPMNDGSKPPYLAPSPVPIDSPTTGT
ncbi:intradiol ring-cleavage dioxygenase-like protein [Naviculisporaceae sp. PSN 640]